MHVNVDQTQGRRQKNQDECLRMVVGSICKKAPCDMKKEKKLAGWERVEGWRERMLAKNK